MKIAEYRKETAGTLSPFFGDEAGSISDILFCHYLGVDRSGLILMGGEETPAFLPEKLRSAIDELSLGVPVQYVIGECWFYGINIKIGKGCFIPRSDTEVLVKAALAALPPGGVFADICTGSGCIAAAIAHTRKDARGVALELSPKALAFAGQNLAEHPNVKVLRFDAVDEDDYLKLRGQFGEKFDLITCNPPYIPTGDIDFLDQQVLYEPKTSLDGGEDGLFYYREIIKLLDIILKKEGTVIFEVGRGQAHDVSAILAKEGYCRAVIKDLNQTERVILAKKY